MASLLVTALLFLLSGLFAPPGATAQELVAELDYGTFEGAYSAQYNISYWQKIPFAQPPVGDLRFRGPQPPLPVTNGTFNSSQPFDMCVQRTVNGSEDCLYLGLYSRPWTKGEPLRPVVVVFYGGAFVQGSAYFSIPPSAYPILNVSSETDLVFVYPNYRTNAFGFLPGAEVAGDAGSDLNPGLLDQDAAIRWASKYAASFGGDPDSISIWGQSAGGGSVVAQAIARAGVPDRPRRRLFTRALASSPFWPKTYDGEAPEAQAVYDMFSSLAGCGTGTGSLGCLKTTDVQTLRDASLAVAASHTYNSSSYTWAPVIDGKFLTMRLSEAAAAGEVNMEFAWGMYNTHEGENFIPPGLQNAQNSGTPAFNSSVASFDGWLSGFLPGLDEADLNEARALYPESGSAEAVSSYNDSYTRAGLVYRDVVLACPAYWFSGSAPEGSYLGEYSISPAKHASDTIYWNQVNAVQKTDPLHYKGYTGAFASYFMTSDPNEMKLTGDDEPGVPPLLPSGKEFNINAAGFAQLELTQFKGRCDFWKSLAPKIPI